MDQIRAVDEIFWTGSMNFQPIGWVTVMPSCGKKLRRQWWLVVCLLVWFNTFLQLNLLLLKTATAVALLNHNVAWQCSGGPNKCSYDWTIKSQKFYSQSVYLNPCIKSRWQLWDEIGNVLSPMSMSLFILNKFWTLILTPFGENILSQNFPYS